MFDLFNLFDLFDLFDLLFDLFVWVNWLLVPVAVESHEVNISKYSLGHWSRLGRIFLPGDKGEFGDVFRLVGGGLEGLLEGLFDGLFERLFEGLLSLAGEVLT